jgi:serine protein kinase
MTMKKHLDTLASSYDVGLYQKLNRTFTVSDYIEAVYDKTSLARSAYQRLYDCIMAKGVVLSEKYRETITHYKFFDSEGDGDIGVFGLDKNLMELVASIRGASRWYGPERRLILLHGPVGSAKSTICRKFKRGLENYSKTDDGELYTFKWHDVPNDIYVRSEFIDPMHEDPLKLLPAEVRLKMQNELNSIVLSRAPNEKAKAHVPEIRLGGNLNPLSSFVWDSFMEKYNGDWRRILEEHVTVCRFVMDEPTRKGIGTFQPKDEKNQDSTELTGDINYQMLGLYGVDSDPRSFSFDGELQRANRGIMEFIEVLKLAKEFLYDLLGACQERQIKPKKFSQIDVDLVLIGHTNLPDFKRVEADATMEALKDRTIRVDIPYLKTLTDEKNVLDLEFSSKKIRQHIAPHTKYVTALVTVLSRLKYPKKGDVTLLDKAKLYDGKTLENYNEDAVKEMMRDFRDEGSLRRLSAQKQVRYRPQNEVLGKRSNSNSRVHRDTFLALQRTGGRNPCRDRLERVGIEFCHSHPYNEHKIPRA